MYKCVTSAVLQWRAGVVTTSIGCTVQHCYTVQPGAGAQGYAVPKTGYEVPSILCCLFLSVFPMWSKFMSIADVC